MTVLAGRSKKFILSYLVVASSGTIGTTFANAEDTMLDCFVEPAGFIGFERGDKRTRSTSWCDVSQEFPRPLDVFHDDPPVRLTASRSAAIGARVTLRSPKSVRADCRLHRGVRRSSA